MKGFSEGSDNQRRGAQVTRMISPTNIAPYREDARVPRTATDRNDMLEIVRPLVCATTLASCGTWQEGRGHIKRFAGTVRLLVLVSLVSLLKPAAALSLHPAGQCHSRLPPCQRFPLSRDLATKPTQTSANSCAPTMVATGALAFAATAHRLPAPARNSPRATCSPALRASSDGESLRPKTAGPSIARRRRQGRVIGRFLFRKLQQYVDLSMERDLGRELVENAFDSSINVVDVTLARIVTDADRSVLQLLPGALKRAVFVTGNGRHAAQSLWTAACDFNSVLLLPMKHLVSGLVGVNTFGFGVGSFIASHDISLLSLRNALHLH